MSEEQVEPTSEKPETTAPEAIDETSETPPADSNNEDPAATEEQAQEESLVEETNEKPAQEESQPNYTDFVKHLVGELPEEERKSKLRILNNGLFVEETIVKNIAELYYNWAKANSVQNAPNTTEKCFARLYTNKYPRFSYLLDGKKCLTGHLVEGKIDGPQKIDIPFMHSGLLDATSFIHPRDQLFERIPNVKAELDSATGLRFEFNVGKRTYYADSDFLNLFWELSTNNKRIQQEFPQISRSVRFAAEAIASLLGKARRVGDKDKLLIPAKFRNQNKLTYLKVGAIRFLVDDQTLIHCYELKAKNQAIFVRTELAALRNNRKLSRIGIFQVSRQRDRHIGIVTLKGMTYKVSAKTLNRFITLATDFRAPEANLKQQFTLRDCIFSLAKLCEDAVWKEKKDLPKHMLSEITEDGTVLKSGDWVFMIINRDTISNCYTITQKKFSNRKGRNKNKKTPSENK